MDIDYGAVFGVDLGANEQEAAAPADTNEAQGEKEQEVAVPAAEEEPAESEAENGDTEEADKTEQTPEMRAKFAAIRRKAEADRDAAIAKMKADLEADKQKAMDEMYANSGIYNPYTKKQITNKQEYDEYIAQRQAEQKQQMMRKAGMNEDAYKEFVDSLPEVQEARQAKMAAEAAQKAANEEAAKVRIDEQIKAINAIDPSINSLEDISKMPTYDRFYELVKRGNTLVDAYRLANIDNLVQGAASASRQMAIKSANGKQHLEKTQARGQGAVMVPEDIKAQYLMFNPAATDAEIQAHYNRHIKK